MSAPPPLKETELLTDAELLANLPARPDPSFAGHVALVTGAGAHGTYLGNGRAIAMLLAAAGCNVVCIDISLPAAEMTVAMIQADARAHPGTAYGTALPFKADVTSDADCAAAAAFAIEKWGRIDVLVNVVGVIGPPGTAETLDAGAWAKALELNVTAMAQMAKYALPHLAANPLPKHMPPTGPVWRGSIVNLGSVAGLRGGTPSLLYPTAKGAVVNMSRAMAAQHAHQGVRVNCVCPGMVYTPMMFKEGMSEEMRNTRRDRSLLKTEGDAWDVASAV
ncbi:dehydrogenase with different specificitie, partial [Trichodelitschia bisporula]